MKKVIKRISYLLWRLLKGNKFDKAADKYRNEILTITNDFMEGEYAYLGFGTVLKLYRDNECKMQDMDFIISEEFYKSKKFTQMIKKLELKKWHEYKIDNEIVIDKYMYKNEAPVEFFIAKISNKHESTLHFFDDGIYERKIIKVKPILNKKYNFPVMFPENEKDYILSIYGETWNQNIKTTKYDGRFFGNTSTLIKTNLKGQVN